ncbi:hypothetical protein EGW08_005895 [Elysia chlorotica]|uniref:BTB domain-containing protein n=1 Tax=Elysia chlorotica TaxID=188477 RepID=A0A3S1BE81_ELYCH|nr:hypothetical protein EGW08_005895 [Elysia chlorotica]
MLSEVPLDGAVGCIGRPNPPSTQDVEMKKVLSAQACQVLAELRKTGELCDAIIKVDDLSFPIHRNILSACSPYFRALFTNSRFDQNSQEICITGVSPDSMAAIIDYAYTRHVKLSWSNIEELLPAADRFLVSGLVKPCCEFLRKSINAENCIGIRNFAHSYSCRELEKHANNFILRKFQEVSATSQEFLNMHIDQLTEILDSDYLNVRNEEMVFDAVIRWIDHNPETRKQEIARLLNCIRLGIITTRTFIEKLSFIPHHKYLKKKCQKALNLIKTVSGIEWAADRESLLYLYRSLIRSKLDYGSVPNNYIRLFDIIISNNTSLKLYNCIYRDSVQCIELIQVFPCRCYVSVAELDGLIYAMGGFDGQLRLNSVERFNRKTNQWSFIPTMNHRRSDARATTMGGGIYICGGFNGQECLNTSEYFDPSTSQWTLISPMRNRRSGVGVIAYNGMIYALGGFNGITRMNTGERYCPTRKTWSTIPEMYSPRSNFAIEVIDDMIFVIGGFNGVTTIFNVECYDSKADEWYDAHDLSLYRSALSACVVRGLPNVLEFIHSDH